MNGISAPGPPAGRHPSGWATLAGYLRLPHAVPVLVVMLATAGFALVATGGSPPAGALARVLLAMLGGQLAIGAVNELVDADLDALVKPSKPIPAGLVSRRGAWIMTAGGLLLMTLFSATLGWRSLLLCAAGTGLGLVYSLWFKRTPLAWLPYWLALPLLPIWVWTALDAFPARLLALYPLGAVAILSVHLAQSIPDIEPDRASGVRTLAARLGERRSLAVMWGGTALTALGLAAVASVIDASRVVAFASSGLALLLIAVNLLVYQRAPRRGVMLAFPCVALATAGLGLGWVLAISPVP